MQVVRAREARVGAEEHAEPGTPLPASSEEDEAAPAAPRTPEGGAGPGLLDALSGVLARVGRGELAGAGARPEIPLERGGAAASTPLSPREEAQQDPGAAEVAEAREGDDPGEDEPAESGAGEDEELAEEQDGAAAEAAEAAAAAAREAVREAAAAQVAAARAAAAARAEVPFSLLDVYALPELIGDRALVEEILSGPDSHELGAAPLREGTGSREVALYSDLEAEAVLHNLPEEVVLTRLGSSLRGHLPLGSQGPAPELELPEPTPPAPTWRERRANRRRRRRGEDVTRPPTTPRPAPRVATDGRVHVPSPEVLILGGGATRGDIAEAEAASRRRRRREQRRRLAVGAGILVVLALAVSAPVLYLRGGEEPVDPARRALEVYAASLAGDTRFDAEAELIEPQLIRRPLGDGRVEVVSLIPGGSCWVLTVEPDGEQSIERGTPIQCRRQEGDQGGVGSG